MDPKSLDELRALLAVLRDHGVTRYVFESNCIELAPGRPPAQAAAEAPKAPPRVIPPELAGLPVLEQERLLGLYGAAFAGVDE